MRKQLFAITMMLFAALIVSGLFAFKRIAPEDERMVSIRVAPKQIQMFWNDERGKTIGSLANLKAFTERKHQQLLFAMNGGMYQEDQSPLGLYIENGKQLKRLNAAQNKFGNFYLNPNGVFYITTDNKAVVCTTQDFRNSNRIKFATQSGPMLVINGQIHPKFTKGSTNVNVRNGVGIMPDGSVVLAMSKGAMNLYDFAAYFRDLGCANALFFDGFVCRTYHPAKKWLQMDGGFGVMVGVVR